MTLDERIARMRAIFRGQEAYGEGSPKEQCEAYYQEHLRDEVIALVVERHQGAENIEREPIDMLISLSGFSPMTSILSYECLQPARLMIITSLEAQKEVNKIGQYILGEGLLDYANFSHRTCQPADALSIYRIVKEVFDSLTAVFKGRRPRIVIDITGGKKVMSATAALCAWQLDTAICYINTDKYDPELRRPTPGTEALMWINNPSTLFGDQELTAIEDIFDSGGFETAAVRFQSLAERVSTPWKARFRAALAQLYQAWSSLELAHLPSFVERVEGMLDEPLVALSHVHTQRIRHQLAFLKRLAQRQGQSSMLMCYYLLGLHYQQLGRHDFAALLFYRTTEGCMTSHLELAYSPFDARQGNFEAMGCDVEALREKYCEVCREIFPRGETTRLPTRLGFMDSAVVLHCLEEDKLLSRAHIVKTNALKWLSGCCEVRNRSVLAHGFDPVTEKDCTTFQELAKRILRAFWQQHHPQESVDEQVEMLTFIKWMRR